MPLNRAPLALASDPRSVAEARRSVAGWCREIDRDDLVECAELAVSELVTNALLHAKAPITLCLRGTREHPRIEVSDASPTPPSVPMSTSEELDDLLLTFGRGLSIVAMCSVTWGAATEAHGKIVWFEPATAPHKGPPPAAEIFDDGWEVPQERPDWIDVDFLRTPVDVLREARRHYGELRRELRILALAHHDDYPLAAQVTEAFHRFEQAFDNGLRAGRNEPELPESGFVDLHTAFDPAEVPLVRQVLDLLDLADEFCRTKRLLSLARKPHVRSFQQWYFGEFARQAAGYAPTPCPALERAPTEPAR